MKKAIHIQSNTKSAAKRSAKPDAKPYTKTCAKPHANPVAKPKPKPKPEPNMNTGPGRISQTFLTVDQENELLKFLIAQLPQEGRNHIKSLLARGRISVEGKVTTLYNYPLLAGQKVIINRGKVYHRAAPAKRL